MKDRKKLEECFRAGVDAVEPRRLVGDWLETNRIKADSFLAIGKASPAMAMGATDVLDLVGIVVTTDEAATDCLDEQNLVFRTGHPLPDDRGIEAGIEVEKFLRKRKEDSTLLILISGGGSALLPTPYEQLGLVGLKILTKNLMEKGATIQEMNTIRRHVERLKGGGIAKNTKANIICLMISDVMGDEMRSIASGPTVPDPTTCMDAEKILAKYRIDPGVEAQGFLDSCWWETPKKDDPLWDRVENHILANNQTAVDAAAKRMEELYSSTVFKLNNPIVGEARKEALHFCNLVEEKGLAIGGGETVVNVQGTGTGGRNQEMALAGIAEDFKASMLFASTDGRDGPTDAAGGFCDMQVRIKAGDMGLDPRLSLNNNDSYGFLSWTDGLFKTGATGTNVCDLAMGVFL